jgi:DNA repair protein RadC
MQKGPSALSSVELIAILLGSGTKKRSVLELAADVLAQFGTLERLADATLQELLVVPGIGPAKGIQLQAALALWKRIKPLHEERPLIDSAEKAFAQIHPEIVEEKTEVAYVLLRDARRCLLHKEAIAVGTLNQVLMHPREIFCSAIRHRAHSLIVAHNHPSGDPTPSPRDLEATSMLRTSGQVIGIELVDHLIIGQRGYFSFREQKIIASGNGY